MSRCEKASEFGIARINMPKCTDSLYYSQMVWTEVTRVSLAGTSEVIVVSKKQTEQGDFNKRVVSVYHVAGPV